MTHIPANIVGEVELHARQQYCKRFGIDESDVWHAKWDKSLKHIINNAYVNIDEEKRMRQERLHRVHYEPVCVDSLNSSLSRLSLDTGRKFEDKKKANANVDDEWDVDDDQDAQNINQCDRIAKNQFLFDYYYKRANDLFIICV